MWRLAGRRPALRRRGRLAGAGGKLPGGCPGLGWASADGIASATAKIADSANEEYALRP